MADNWTLKGVSRADDRLVPDGDAPLAFAGSPPPRPRTSFVSIAAAVIALISLGGTAWLYAETQREIKRVSTDIAQIRLSLELFGQQQAAAGNAAADTSTDSSADELQALANRLALVEANQASAISAATSLPALPTGDAAGGAVATGDDCLPVGTRFMMAAGDSYPVCGTTGTVAIAAVDNGYVTLSDGTIIAQGGTVGLPGTQCMLGVMPSESDGLSGFAEVRVSC